MTIDRTAKQLKISLIILAATILGGTLGYYFIETDFSIFDAFYMTIITISTTGFREVRDLSDSGRFLTIFVIIAGVVLLAYSGSRALQILIETQVFRRRKMSKQLDELEGHYIVCGYGRMGSSICEGLKLAKKPFVIIEKDQEKVEELLEFGYLFINGDATDDDDLIKAGIKRAKGLVATTRTDAENVFTTLSAKQLNPNVFVVARAVEEESESKLKKAGADRVVKPYELGGNRMIQLLLRPGVAEFIDGVIRDSNLDIALEEVKVLETSPLVGKSLNETPIREELDIIVIAIQKDDGKFIYKPKSWEKIAAGDKLIATGQSSNLTELSELCLKV